MLVYFYSRFFVNPQAPQVVLESELSKNNPQEIA